MAIHLEVAVDRQNLESKRREEEGGDSNSLNLYSGLWSHVPSSTCLTHRTQASSGGGHQPFTKDGVAPEQVGWLGTNESGKRVRLSVDGWTWKPFLIRRATCSGLASKVTS